MAQVWFCKISGEQLGPFSSRQLKGLVAQGRLAPGDHVRQGAEGPWLRAGEVRGLFPHGGPVAEASDSQGLPVARPLRPSPVAPPKARPAAPRGVEPTARGGGTADTGVIRRPTRRRHDALLVGLPAVLVVGLAAVGAVLLLGDRDVGWFAAPSARPADETSARSPAGEHGEIVGASDPLADGRWLDASKESTRQGDVGLRISSVIVSGPEVVQEALHLPGRPRRPLMLIAVELENTSADRKVGHVSWGGQSPGGSRATLTDDSDRVYRPKRFRGVNPEGEPASRSIGPGEKTEDLLVFDPPAEDAEYLLLSLPVAASGEPGGKPGEVCFRIPREMIVEAGGALGSGDPFRVGGGGVPEIERGIAELKAAEGRARAGAGPTEGPPVGDDDPGGDVSAINRGIEELGGGERDDEDSGPSIPHGPDDSHPPRREGTRQSE